MREHNLIVWIQAHTVLTVAYTETTWYSNQLGKNYMVHNQQLADVDNFNLLVAAPEFGLPFDSRSAFLYI